LPCDTGPGNALLDDLMLKRLGAAFDRDGATASRGKANVAVLDALLAHPFFRAPPPKSLDRNDFLGTESLATEDAAATLTAFTAASIAGVLPLLPTRPDCLRRRRAQQNPHAGIGGAAALPGRSGGKLRLVERRHGSPGLRLSRGAAAEESADYVSDDHGGR
jgi:Anhydro-N-acetylmuramic acid kinase